MPDLLMWCNKGERPVTMIDDSHNCMLARIVLVDHHGKKEEKKELTK